MADIRDPDAPPDDAQRIEDLRAFEREYRSLLLAKFREAAGILNMTGEALTSDQRWYVEEARKVLAVRDREMDDARLRELHAAGRMLLAVIDQVAPKAGG